MDVIERIFGKRGSRTGIQKRIAVELGIKPQTVNEWITKGKKIPVKHIFKIERITGIPSEEIRPDIFL